MARPRKTGLDYFPFDVDFFEDEKIVAIAGEFGIKGEIAAVKLLCAIYRNGYFIEWNEMLQMKILRNLGGVSPVLLDQIVNRLVKWGFFDASLFDSVKILTSRGIQKRYFEISKRRRSSGSLPHLLVSTAETTVSTAETTVYVNKNPQSKEKESKLKKEIYPPAEDKEKQQQMQQSDSGKEKLPSGTGTAAPAIDPALKKAITRICTGTTGTAIAADFGIELPEVEAVAREIAAEWTELGEWNRDNPATHLMRTIRCRLRDRSSPSLPGAIPVRNETQARIAAEREQEKAERDAALSIDSRAALAQYMASQGLDSQTSLANQLKK